MKQTSMFETFEDQRLSRKSDPETSKQAAKSVDVVKNELVFIEVLGRLGIATAEEIKEGSEHYKGIVSETVRKRAGGLKKKGLIRVIDRNGVSDAGNSCERFELTDEAKRRFGYE